MFYVEFARDTQARAVGDTDVASLRRLLQLGHVCSVCGYALTPDNPDQRRFPIELCCHLCYELQLDTFTQQHCVDLLRLAFWKLFVTWEPREHVEDLIIREGLQ